MRFKNTITVFIDILGFRAKVNQASKNSSDLKKLYADLKYMQDFFSDGFIPLKKRWKITHFSDSVVISFDYQQESEFFTFLDQMMHFLFNLVRRGILCRGGIYEGQLLHTNKIIFGPGLVNAYELESKVAIYPRVVLSRDILDKVIQFPIDHNTSEEEEIDYQGYITIDSDGLYFVDYINKIKSILDDDSDFHEYIHSLKRIIDDFPCSGHTLAVKRGWLITKFNKLVDEYGLEKILQISKYPM